eukprot:scaffold12676_cov112-Isochrysis_galbana.AAC.4
MPPSAAPIRSAAALMCASGSLTNRTIQCQGTTRPPFSPAGCKACAWTGSSSRRGAKPRGAGKQSGQDAGEQFRRILSQIGAVHVLNSSALSGRSRGSAQRRHQSIGARAQEREGSAPHGGRGVR